jgi:hypothetical protein
MDAVFHQHNTLIFENLTNFSNALRLLSANPTDELFISKIFFNTPKHREPDLKEQAKHIA